MYTRGVGPGFEGKLRVCDKILQICGNDANYSLIHQAIFGTTSISLQTALEIEAGSINMPDSDGRTPLHWAAYRDNIDNMRLLISHGADVRLTDKFGLTALHIVIRWESVEAVQLLLDAGADINVESGAGISPLFESARQHALPICELLIKNGGKSGRSIPNLRTPLHAISDFEHPIDVALAGTLTAAGVDVNSLDLAGWSPIFFSVRLSTPVGVRTFSDLGADPTIIDKAGRSILHLAAQHSNRETIEALEGRLGGVDPDLVDQEGMTAMDYLRDRKLQAPKQKDLQELIYDAAQAFERLMADVRRQNQTRDESSQGSHGKSNDSSDSDDVFYDSMERR
jgi:ankyrin repeat protein